MGLIRMMGRTAVVAGTATAVSNRVSRRQAGRWADQEQAEYNEQQAQLYQQQQQAAAAAAAAAPAPPPAAAEPEYMEELQKLSQLKNAGIITPEEFEAKKRQILGI